MKKFTFIAIIFMLAHNTMFGMSHSKSTAELIATTVESSRPSEVIDLHQAQDRVNMQRNSVITQWFSFDTTATQDQLEQLLEDNEKLFPDPCDLLNATKHDGDTLLHTLAMQGLKREDELYNALVSLGADPNYLNNNHETFDDLALERANKANGKEDTP